METPFPFDILNEYWLILNESWLVLNESWLILNESWLIYASALSTDPFQHG